MNIFLPLLYSLLLGSPQKPAQASPAKNVEATPVTQVWNPELAKQVYQPTGLSRQATAAPITTTATTADCKANATLTDIGAGPFGSPFIKCSPTSTAYVLKVENASTTKATNKGYRINWGDGSTELSFTSDFAPVSHTYLQSGVFNLTFTAIDESGCETTSTYKVYNITDPGFTLVNEGDNRRCLTPDAPTRTLTYKIAGIDNNPPSTIYTFTFDDGSPDEVYTHAEMLAKGKIEHTFAKSSCSMPGQVFSIKGTAAYVCGGSTIQTRGGIPDIVINKSTEADFTIGGTAPYCAGGNVVLGNATINPELCPINFSWEILNAKLGEDYEYVTGNSTSSGVTIKFKKAGTYDVKLRTLTSGCGEDDVTKQITIVEKANAAFELDTNESQGCKNLLVTPTNTSTGYQISYAWTVKKGTSNTNAEPNKDYILKSGTKVTDKEPQFEFLKEGKYSLQLITKNNCSTSSVAKQEITVKGLPTVTLSQPVVTNCGPFEIAYGTAAALTSGKYTPTPNFGTISKYNWSVTNGATFTSGNATSPNPKISFPAPGEYTVTLTIENECGASNTATQQVTVNDFPAAPQAKGEKLCTNDVARLSVISPIANYTYRWYSVATGGTSLFTGTTFPTPPLQGNTTYYVEAESDKGCKSQTRTAVEVKALSAVTGNTIKTDQTICEGETPLELEGGEPAGGGGAPYTFLWEISENGTDFTAAPADANGRNDQKNYSPTGSFKKTTSFRRKVYNTPCQTVNSNIIVITVVPTPKQPVVANAGICYGQSATLVVENAEANVAYSWYDAPTGGTPLSSEASYKTAPLYSDKTYYVAAVSKIKASCFLSTRTKVEVKVTPAMVGGDKLTSPQPSVCYGTAPTAAITGDAPTGGTGTYTYKWFSSTKNNPALEDFTEINAPAATLTDYKPGNLTQTTWFMRVARSGDCATASAAVKIEVEALPVAPSVTGTTTICFGGSTTLTAIAPGESYRWYDKNNTLVSSENTLTPTLEATTVYTVEAISATGCVSPRTTVTITVTPPIQNNKITGDQTVCRGSSVSSLGGTLPTGGGEAKPRFLWEYRTEDGSYQAAPGDNSKQTYQPTGTFTENTWFRRTVYSDPCQQHLSNEVKITVIPLPQAPVVADTSACYGTTVTLAVTAPVKGIKYNWYETATGNSLLQIDNTSYKTPILKDNVTYYVEAVSDNDSKCTSTSRTPVTVTVTPALNGGDVIGTSKPVVCAGDTPGTLDGDAPSNGGNGKYEYQWFATTKNNPAPEDFKEIIDATHKAYTPVSITETTRFKRVVYSASCSKESIVIRVVAEPTPVAPIVKGNLSICGGGATILTATASSGSYNWYDADGEFLLTATNFPTRALEATTTYQVEAESATGCVGPRTTVTINVTPVITNTITPEKTAICAGDDAGTIGGAISGGTGTFDIFWEKSENGKPFVHITEADEMTSYSPGNLVNTTAFRRTVKSENCVSQSNEVVIGIANTIAANTITGGKTICAGSTPGTLSGNGEAGFEYQWYYKTESQTEFTEVVGPKGQRQDLSPDALTETTLFRRDIKSGNCSSTSNTIQVTVQQQITNNTVRNTGQDIICYNSKPDILEGAAAQNGTGYIWQTAKASAPTVWTAAPGINNQKDYSPTQNLTAATLYRRLVLADKCEPSESNIINISVAQPVVNKITTAITTYCVGAVPEAFKSSQPLATTGTITWERSLNGGPAQVVARTEDYTPADALGAGTWTYRRIVNSGCGDVVSNVLTIEVNAAITGNAIRKPDPACVNATITLEPEEGLKGGNSKYAYQWQQSFDGVTFTNINKATNTYANDPYLVVSVTKHTWFRRVVTSGGCSNTSDAVELLQPIKNNRILTAIPPTCSPAIMGEIRGSQPSEGNGKYEYLWEKRTEGEDITFVTAPGNNTGQHYTPPTPLTMTTEFRRIVKSGPCQQLISENVVKVEIRPIPAAPSASDVTICHNTIATLKATGEAGKTMVWYDSQTGGNQLFVGNTYQTKRLTENVTYYVEAKDQFNCSSSERREVKITVVTPLANAGEDISLAAGKGVELSGSGGVKYSWAPAKGLSDATVANPMASPKETTTYTLTITTAEGCTDTDQVTVTVLPRVDPANVMTVNNDGHNDKFNIKNIEKYPDCRVEIYTRWGEKVFESVGYKEAWDGTKNGKPLPVAAYYYIIYLSKEEAPISGSVTILK